MNMIKVGPVGGYGASKHSTIWSEKGRDQVAGFRITYGKHSVYSLQFMYYENDRLVLSDRHGDCDDDEKRNFVPVVFDYPSEYLTSISCSVPMDHAFGRPSTDGNDIDFDLSIGNRRLFGGFHGSENCYGVGSIGVYLKTESNDQEGSSSNKASKRTKSY
ncbi:PREDICTED: inactive protein RESTRICTED TEV MOVEMENT 1-like [Nicotiana attenuata]|uniref:inactive protein RESTRICTED TEV MOVEMENT 1-like n=1 Tax=Nicotiana attenuata TaxID=49451 RepID=UPI000904836E|nr:PREDICTED: inactive protein RESTRICTED TEV MOVEMENT 1-like [Nicotiana attenuata]